MRLATKIVLPLLVVAVFASGAYALWKTKPQTPRQTPPEKSWVVEAATVNVENIQPTLNLFGEVVAGRQVELRPLVAGQIVKVGDQFLEGGTVSKGDLLVAIDPFDYKADVDERQAQLDEAMARMREIRAEYESARSLLKPDKEQVEIRKREVARREKLRGAGASSVKALDDARLALLESEQRLVERKRAIETWKSKLDQQKSTITRQDVALRRARRDLEQTRLLAPFDGYVLNVDAEIGKRLGVGDRVAQLIDAARLEVRFHISNALFAELSKAGGYAGREAMVRWDGGIRPLTAVLQREGSSIETASGGVNLYASLQPADSDSGLRPGAFVRVELPGPKYEAVIRLPDSALHNDDTVYVIVDKRLQPRKTRRVAQIGSDVLVEGGLQQGESVLITRLPEIGQGVLVNVQ